MSLALVLNALAVLAWLSAAVHAVMLVPHRRPGLTVGQLVVGGYRFFLAETFTEQGRKLHRRFITSVLMFVGCLIALMVVSLLLAG